MACPFFVPVRRIGPGPWDPAPRMPLGDVWEGECWSGSAPFSPSEPELRDMCNTGYPRGRCSRFPESAAADAVRFVLTAGDGPGQARVRYVREKDHVPVEYGPVKYGPLEYGPVERDERGTVPAGREVLQRQALAFLEAHPERG